MALTEETPVPPTAGYKGDITASYSLRYPKYDEVAEVPQDMANLAFSVERALNGKVNGPANTNISAYQLKIVVVVGTTPPASAAEGTVIFLIAP